jgi:hypothetical protein
MVHAMIKFVCRGKQPGQTMIGLGLSRLNCERLLAGQPILIDAKTALNLPWPIEIALFAGEDEKALITELKKAGFELPSDPARIHIDPKLGL